jgi:hypothetical protein
MVLYRVAYMVILGLVFCFNNILPTSGVPLSPPLKAPVLMYYKVNL